MKQDDIAYMQGRYRCAKCHRKAVQILAQEFDCQPGDIKRLLGIETAMPSTARKRKHNRYAPALREKIGREIVALGLTLGQAEIKYGINRYTLGMWVLPYRHEKKNEVGEYVDIKRGR